MNNITILKRVLYALCAVGALSISAVANAQFFYSTGAACSAPVTSLTFAGTTPVTVNLCATVTTGSFCGHTVQLLAAAGEGGQFSVTSRVAAAPFAAAPYTDAGTALPQVIGNPTPTADLGASGTGSTGYAPAGTSLLATLGLTPAATAVNASYVVSFDPNSILVLGDAGTCANPSVDANPFPSLTLTKAVVTNTAPTATIAAAAQLTAGTGTVPVTVATPGAGTGSLGLICTIPGGTASFAVASGGTRTISAPATLGVNSPAIGLTCTPQATSQTATLTCAQTATPGPNPPSLTSTITCPAAAAASITYTAAPAVLTFAGVTAGTPTATQSVTVAANAANTGALNVASCAFGGANAADFSFSPAQTFPQSVAAGASAALPVRFTPAAADSAARSATLTCQTPNATAAGATSFVVTLNGTNPAPVPIVITPTTPAGNVVLPALTIGATPAFVTTGLNFSVSGGAATLTCVVAGAGYTATGSPLSLVVGTTRTLTVTYTGATAGTFTGTLTCTSTAPATGGPFVYNLSTTVQAAPAIGPTVQVPTIGAFGLGLLGLLIAGFAGWVQRRQVK